MMINMHPMYKIAATVSTAEGKEIASGLSDDKLRVPFFLGAFHYGQQEIVQHMMRIWKWPQSREFLEQLQKEIIELRDYEPEMIQWLIYTPAYLRLVAVYIVTP